MGSLAFQGKEFGVEPPGQILHLPTYDSPGGSTDDRFHLLQNYCRSCYTCNLVKLWRENADVVLVCVKLIRWKKLFFSKLSLFIELKTNSDTSLMFKNDSQQMSETSTWLHVTQQRRK